MLTPEQIEQIRVLYMETGTACKIIGRQFNRSEKAIRSLSYRMGWPKRRPRNEDDGIITPEDLEKIREMYEESSIPCKIIGAKFNRSDKSIRSMSFRYGWKKRRPDIGERNKCQWEEKPEKLFKAERVEIALATPEKLTSWNRHHMARLHDLRYDDEPMEPRPMGEPLCEQTQAKLNATIRAHKPPRRADMPCEATTEIVVDLRSGRRTEARSIAAKREEPEELPPVTYVTRCPVCQKPMPNLRDYQRYCTRKCYLISRGAPGGSNGAPPPDMTILGPVQQIQGIVCALWDIPIETMTAPGRRRKYAYPRHAAMHLCSKFMPTASLPQLGRLFGGRDHTTVMHGINATETRLANGEPEDFCAMYREAEKRVRIALGIEQVVADMETRGIPDSRDAIPME